MSGLNTTQNIYPGSARADDVNNMNVKRLKQELTERSLPTHGLKATLVERVTDASEWKHSNEAFHSRTKQIKDTAAGIASAEDAVAALEQERAQLETSLAANQQKLIDQRWHIPGLKRKEREAQAKLKELEPRLFFAPKLPACVLLSIVGQLGKQAGQRAACVKREWRGSVETAKALGMYKSKFLLSVGRLYALLKATSSPLGVEAMESGPRWRRECVSAEACRGAGREGGGWCIGRCSSHSGMD